MCLQICSGSRKEEGIRVPVPDACATFCGKVFQHLKDPKTRVLIGVITFYFCLTLSLLVLTFAALGAGGLYIDFIANWVCRITPPYIMGLIIVGWCSICAAGLAYLWN